ncbi:MAG: ATP-binding protein [Oligoflexales bacterium]|nr:ATP-binding protein [Oligoflexales bacterium]
MNSAKSKLTVIFGRRRVGKTALVMEHARKNSATSQVFYSQAIEGAESLQVDQISQELFPLLPDIKVNTWLDFFKLLARTNQKCTVVIDEFPYLVRSQPSLPSILQKWLDHHCPEGMRLILLGSSQTLMHDIFLKSSAPLYERASEILHIKPLGYNYFCEALRLDTASKESYLIYSMIGGIPKYWEFVEKGKSLLKLADELYFEIGARLEYEPERVLKDENIVGEQARSILELVGRGAVRPSEIASRLGIRQTSLSNPIQLLRDASLLEREIPFGESSRSTKRSVYKIYDHCLSFWYTCYSPHRIRWSKYKDDMKLKIIQDHASLMFEKDFRSLFRDASRYWESEIEFDSVRYADESEDKIIVSEVKFKKLSSREKKNILDTTFEKFQKSQLSRKFKAEIEAIGLDEGLKALSS